MSNIGKSGIPAFHAGSIKEEEELWHKNDTRK